MEIFTITEQQAAEEACHLEPQLTLADAKRVCQEFHDELTEGHIVDIQWEAQTEDWIVSTNWNDLDVEYRIAKWVI